MTPRVIHREGGYRVVRTGPTSMVIEEHSLDAMGAEAWVTRVPIEVDDPHRVDQLILGDLYQIFSAWELS